MRTGILVVLICLWLGCLGQQGYMKTVFGTRNGLLSPKLYALHQSTNRMLWVGSELGLSAFDGISFTNYQYTADNQPIGRILAIAEDSSYRTWFGGDRGLFFLQDHRVFAANRENLAAVESLLTDKYGNLFIGGLESLYCISRETQAQWLQNKAAIPLRPFMNFAKRTYSMTPAYGGGILAGTNEGIYHIDSSGASMLWATDQPGEGVHTLLQQTGGRILAGMPYSLPFAIEKGAKKALDIPWLPRKWVSTGGNSWLFTTNNLLAVTDTGYQVLLRYDSLLHHVHTALVDAEGNAWAATWEGLVRYRPSAFVQYPVADKDYTEIFSMLETQDGMLLFGGNKGRLYQQRNGRLEPLSQMPRLVPNAELLCLTQTKDGAIWAGSGYEGIARWQQGKLQHWMPQGLLKDNNCEALYPLPDGNLLACTEQGVTLINPQLANPFVAHYPYAQKFARLPELFGAIQIKRQTWVYGSHGLFRLQEQQLVADSIAGIGAAIHINTMVTDGLGNIWAATMGKGLLQCRVTEGGFGLVKRYDKAAGMPTNLILSVTADNNNRIWAAGYAGIFSLQTTANGMRITVFDDKDGLPANYYAQAKLEQQRDGHIWMITPSGVTRFHPDSVGFNPLPPGLFWNRIAVNGLGQHEDSVLTPAGAVSLPYNFSGLRFAFTGVCLSDPSKLLYAWRLLGSDTNWTMQAASDINMPTLRPGNYTMEVKAANNNGIWTAQPIRYSFTINPPWWRRAWFLLPVILLAAGIAYLLTRRRLKTIRQKAALQQQLATLEAKAIRAQMNPHFIFNCLNAIQESIVLSDMDRAYTYLSKFSKLLRMVLSLSEHNMIPLRDELDMNRLYLELESLRFRDSFHYELTVAPDTDEDEIMFPSILIQPLIENAIWHGLMPKTGEKTLSIRYHTDNSMVICTIDDNGIGREKAAALKKQKLGSALFASKALTLVNQRISLLKQAGTTNALIEITDKKSPEGQPLGTTVTITVPLLHQNQDDDQDNDRG